jgi:hypothetical protein
LLQFEHTYNHKRYEHMYPKLPVNMLNANLKSLLHKPVTRKEFLRIGALGTLSLFGITGVVTELLSHAQSPYVDAEAESGTLGGTTATISDGSASGSSAVRFGTSAVITPPPTGTFPTVILPSDAGHYDVTAHGADKTGLKDSTAAINAIMSAHIWGGGGAVCLLYFPAGTYIISGTLAPYYNSQFYCSVIFQGENMSTTTIKMQDGVWTSSSNYMPTAKGPYHAMIHLSSQNYGQPYVGGGGNQAFNNYVFDLTLDLGNNPGGGGLAYCGSNTGAVRRVTINCTAGYTGLDLSPGDNGPCMMQDITVNGPFQMPCNGGSEYQEYSIIMERITLNEGASGASSFTDWGMTYGIKDSTFAQGAKITYGMADVGFFNCKNTITTSNPGGGQVQYYGDGNGNGGFVLSPVDTPQVSWDPLSEWANAAVMGWQAALNSGKSTVYWPLGNFPNPQTTGNLSVPPTVKRITWLNGGANLMNSDNSPSFSGPFFTTTGSSATPLVIERAWGGANANMVFVQHNASRPLIMQDVSWSGIVQGNGGPIFFDDTASISVVVASGQKFYARQFNYENPSQAAITNNGGQVWCLGLKTERSASTPWINANGGRTEVIAGFNYPGTTPPVSSSLVPYQFANASFALQVTNNAYNGASYNYSQDVTLNGKTTGFTYSSSSRGIGNYFTASYSYNGG